MTIRPIPDNLLNDSFTLAVPSESGYEQYYIRKVRIVHTDEVTDYIQKAVRNRSSLVIYYDCTVSLPQNMQFCAGMLIEYADKTWEIVKAEQFCGEAPHHIKITAVKISEGGFADEGQQA